LTRVSKAVAFVPAVLIAIAGWSHRWMNEDAYINLRVVDQIFAGHGPVFNAGERIEVALERADEALYEAKRTGKNKTCVG